MKKKNKRGLNKKVDNKFFIENKKAQGVFGISFGTIFSIFLIIFFIVITFIVIKAFLDTKKCAEMGIFNDKFQSEIEKAWNSPKQTATFKGRLPAGLKYICFANFSESSRGQYDEIWNVINIYEGTNANLFFYPIEESCDMPYTKINHLDLKSIISSENPYCIKVNKGDIDIRIKKELGDKLVRVS